MKIPVLCLAACVLLTGCRPSRPSAEREREPQTARPPASAMREPAPAPRSAAFCSIEGPFPRVPAIQQATREGVRGSIVLRVRYGPDGCLQDARVVRGVRPDLDQAALAAARAYRHRPETRNGRPVAVTTNLEFNLR